LAEAPSLRVYVCLLGDCAGTGKAGRSPAVVLDADFSAEEGDGGDGDSMQSATHTVLTAGRASRRAAAVAGDYAAAMRADATLGQSLQVPTFEFKGHRCIFAAASEFFRERLYRPTSLTSSGRAEPRVTLSPAVTVDAFAAVRSYIYTGQVVVTIDDAVEVIAASALFGLDDLLREVITYAIAALSMENLFMVREPTQPGATSQPTSQPASQAVRPPGKARRSRTTVAAC
jgi:hypothetical protein